MGCVDYDFAGRHQQIWCYFHHDPRSSSGRLIFVHVWDDNRLLFLILLIYFNHILNYLDVFFCFR